MCVKTSLKPAKFRVMLVSVKSLWVDFLVKSKIQHHIGPWLVIYSCFQIWIDLWFESGSVFRPFQNVFMQSTLDKDTIYRWCVDIVLFLVMDFWRISTKKSGHFLVHHCPCRLSILINAAHFCRYKVTVLCLLTIQKSSQTAWGQKSARTYTHLLHALPSPGIKLLSSPMTSHHGSLQDNMTIYSRNVVLLILMSTVQ